MPGALAALVALYCGAPILLKLAAVALMWRFPLDAAAQAATRARIAARSRPQPRGGASFENR